MKPGIVIIDLASQNGGNCEYTIKDQINEVNGVKIVGYTDFPSRMANVSSNLYANNISKLLSSMCTKENKFLINMEDEVVRGSVVTYNGKMLWPNPNPPQLDAKKASVKKEKKDDKPTGPICLFKPTLHKSASIAAGLGSIVGMGYLCPTPAF